VATYVLVHSPLVGPATWQGVAEVLAAAGHEVVVPSLLAATTAGPPFAQGAVDAVAAAVGRASHGDEPVVAGHSGAGPLLPAIGVALGAVRCHLFVDAPLPTPGRTRFADLHPSLRSHLEALVGDDGLLPPWHEWWGAGALDRLVPDPGLRAGVLAELRPLPRALFDEPLPVVRGWPGAACAYLRLSDTYVAEEAAASGLGWPVTTVAGSHLELINAPSRVAAAMEDLVARAVGG
jgi:hypothetical protein